MLVSSETLALLEQQLKLPRNLPRVCVLYVLVTTPEDTKLELAYNCNILSNRTHVPWRLKFKTMNTNLGALSSPTFA